MSRRIAGGTQRLVCGSGAADTVEQNQPVVVLGIVLWAAGVGAARLGTPFGMFDARHAWILLLGSLPLVWLSVRLTGRVGGTGCSLIEAVGLASAPALLLDGVVLTWVPDLYCAGEAGHRAAGAWLLWFVGASLALAFWCASRQTDALAP